MKKNYAKLNVTLVHNLKKKIEELKESENKFRSIFENAIDGILAADAKTKKFVFANPQIYKLTGYNEKELFQLEVGDIHPKKNLPYVIDQFTKQVQGKIALAQNIPVLRKNKKVVYCDINSVLMKINGRELLMGFFRDVTERKKAEQKLLQQKEKHEKELKELKKKIKKLTK